MTRGEIAYVLALCAAYDRRTIGQADVEAWSRVIGDLRLVDVRDAIVTHYTRSNDFVMPSDLRTEVRRIRDERLDRTQMPTPPPDMTPAETILWQRDVVRLIADGQWEPVAIEVGTRPMPNIDDVFPTVEP
jgi:hypothetical protein